MTETEWFQDGNWERHFENVSSRINPRKQRLLAAGFCRQIWPFIEDKEVRDAIVLAEQAADHRAAVAEIERVRNQCRVLAVKRGQRAEQHIDANDPESVFLEEFQQDIAWIGAFVTAGQFRIEEIGRRTRQLSMLASHALSPRWLRELAEGLGLVSVESILRLQRDVLFDLVGNPFRPVAFDPAWRTAAVVAIAVPMLEAGDFSAMPVLADALEDAGCEHEQVLAHCRGEGPHFRGCWVVDGVLGKS